MANGVAPLTPLCLNAASVARSLGLTEAEVNQLIARRILASIKLPGVTVRLVPQSELRRWFADLAREKLAQSER